MKKVFILIPALVFIFTCCFPAQAGTCFFSADKNPKRTFSNPTDYFRSAASGDWGAVTTWESSTDNTNWFPATLVPTSSADIITIRNGHTVTVSSDQNMDQVIINNGGILLHSAGILTIIGFCGCGNDLTVQNGGIFILSSASNPPVFSPLAATANINTGGMLRVSATGLTTAAPNPGVNTSNYIYQNASVLEYTPNLAFSSAGVTFFPNVDAVTIPVFRTTANLGLIGGATPTIINGLFEANGTITFSNSAAKTFRNGIIGTGNIGSDGTSGKFIINGTTASLGGTGSLTLPTGGMDIGNSTTVTMTSDKSVTGTINLLSNALVILGTYNLTMTGSVNGGSATSHIVTNNTGKLVMNNVGAGFVIFPIGANTTTVNFLAISNGEGLNYGARVEIGINPPIGVPIRAVNRTWVVRPLGTPAGTVNVNFGYSVGDGNGLFNYAPATVEQGFYTSVWNVVNTGLAQVGGPPDYQVTGSTNLFLANTDAPMVIANIGAILAANNSVQLIAQKQNEKVILNWTVNDPANVERFAAERSVDGRTYTTLMELPAADLSFIDMQLLPGLNYYRIKMKDKNGKITYSNIAIILNAQKGNELISITPNPVVNGNFKLNISAAQKTQMEILITDMLGRLMQKQMLNLAAGFNTLPLNVSNLASGTYMIYGNTADGRSNLLRFVLR